MASNLCCLERCCILCFEHCPWICLDACSVCLVGNCLCLRLGHSHVCLQLGLHEKSKCLMCMALNTHTPSIDIDNEDCSEVFLCCATLSKRGSHLSHLLHMTDASCELLCSASSQLSPLLHPWCSTNVSHLNQMWSFPTAGIDNIGDDGGLLAP